MTCNSFDQLPNAVSQVIDKLNRIEILLSKPTEPSQPQRFNFTDGLHYLNGLGYTISESKLQKLTASGDIPCKKFNARLVFERNELDAWVQSQTTPVGYNSDAAALTLARNANSKIRRRK